MGVQDGETLVLKTLQKYYPPRGPPAEASLRRILTLQGSRLERESFGSK